MAPAQVPRQRVAAPRRVARAAGRRAGPVGCQSRPPGDAFLASAWCWRGTPGPRSAACCCHEPICALAPTATMLRRLAMLFQTAHAQQMVAHRGVRPGASGRMIRASMVGSQMWPRVRAQFRVVMDVYVCAQSPRVRPWFVLRPLPLFRSRGGASGRRVGVRQCSVFLSSGGSPRVRPKVGGTAGLLVRCGNGAGLLCVHVARMSALPA